MTEAWHAPAWLREALAAAEPPLAAPRVAQGPPGVGEVRLLRDMDYLVDDARLALVLDRDASTGTAFVAIVSSELDFAGEGDYRASSSSEMPGGFLVETDVAGSVWELQLGAVFASVPPALAGALLRVSEGAGPGEAGLDHWRFGLPVRDRHDPRWDWKREELRTLNVLAHECMEWLVDDGELPTFVDPEALARGLDEESQSDEARIDMIEAVASGKERVPLDMLEDLLDVFDAASPQVQTALTPLVDATLAMMSGARPLSADARAVWDFAGAPESGMRTRLGSSLAVAAGEVVRCLRLTTAESSWPDVPRRHSDSVRLTRTSDSHGMQVLLSYVETHMKEVCR